MSDKAALEKATLFNRQLDLDKVEELKERVEKMRQENEALKLRMEKQEKDTHEFVAYFQREMEKKDDMIHSLNETLMLKEIEFEKEREETESAFKKNITELTTAQKSSETRLKASLKMVEDDLSKLEAFRDQKHVLESKMDELDALLKRANEKHDSEMAQMERKFLEEKARMQKDKEKEIEEIRQQSREEARNGLDADTRKIVTDNRRMGEELRFQLQASDELQREKRQLEEECQKLKMEVQINAEKEKGYAKEGHRQQKEIKQLQTKVKSLERSLSQVVRDFEKEHELRAEKVRKELEEATLDAAGLRQLVKLKNKELRNIKKLAQTILDQRTEVEQYFLEAIEQVKSEIRKHREEKYQQEVIEYKAQFRQASLKRGTKFPQIRTMAKPMEMVPGAQSELPREPSKKVDLKELTWEDRERVLRLLFAKINSVQGFVDSVPAHTFDEDDGAGAGMDADAMAAGQ